MTKDGHSLTKHGHSLTKDGHPMTKVSYPITKHEATPRQLKSTPQKQSRILSTIRDLKLHAMRGHRDSTKRIKTNAVPFLTP